MRVFLAVPIVRVDPGLWLMSLKHMKVDVKLNNVSLPGNEFFPVGTEHH